MSNDMMIGLLAGAVLTPIAAFMFSFLGELMRAATEYLRNRTTRKRSDDE